MNVNVCTCVCICDSVAEWFYALIQRNIFPSFSRDQWTKNWSVLVHWTFENEGNAILRHVCNHSPTLWCDVTPHKSGIFEKFHLSWIQISCMRYRMCANQHCIHQTACSVDCQCETLKCAKLVWGQNSETSRQVLPVMPSLHALRQRMYNVMKEITWVQLNFAGFNCVLCWSCDPSISVYVAATMWADIQVL